MAVEITPLGFQKPDGYELVRNGDNAIAANAAKAQEILAAQAARVANLESAAGFTGDPLALNDAAFAETLTSGAATNTALDARLDAKVPPLVAAHIANDPTVANSAATMAQSTAGLVPAWKASTAYTAGQRVIAPNGDVVAAKIAFTSGASYSAANWNASTQDGRVAVLETGKWLKGEIPNGTDLTSTTILAAGLYTISSNAVGDTLVGRPSPVGNSRQGLLESLKSAGGHHRYRYSTQYNVYEKIFRAGAWTGWRIVDESAIELVAADNLDNLKTPGWYCVSFSSTGNQITGWPATMGTKTGLIYVQQLFNGGTGWQQTIYPLSATQLWVRTGAAAWNVWKDAAADAPAATVIDNPHAGLTNQLLVEDWSRRRGGRKKTATGAVAFRFDHGLANFDTKIRPLLEARGIPYSLALCSGQWAAAENTGVTAAMVNTWVQGGLCEIWNHSRNHAGAADEATAQAEIVTGLTELRTQIPAAQIDGFAVPGTAGLGFAPGFVAGTTISEFYSSPGGRIILANHAVSTGYIANTGRRILDGTPRQGQVHSTLDSATLATATNDISVAKTGKLGVQFMMHPSLIDTGAYITTAVFTQILDYVVAERDAGRLKVLGPYDLMLADAT